MRAVLILGGASKIWASRRNFGRAAEKLSRPPKNWAGRSYSVRRIENLGEPPKFWASPSKNWASRHKTAQAAVKLYELFLFRA
ncbi:MAG TPA: hypothetical protein VGK45_14820, partial [Thermoanaerobaculia bacterium]